MSAAGPAVDEDRTTLSLGTQGASSRGTSDDAPSAPRRRVRRKAIWSTPRGRRDAWVFLLFVVPNLALVIIFSWRPIVQNLQYSMLDWTLGNPRATDIGFANYVEFFTYDAAGVLWTTLVFTAVTVGGSLLIGLLLSLVLNRKLVGTTFARASVFAPFVLSGVGIGLLWTFIFDPNVGVSSQILRALGAAVPQWFLDPNLSLTMLCIVFIWKNLGYCAVIYLAGLQAIPKDLLEAASIDGAGAFRRFVSITLPLLSPTTFFLVLTSILASLQAFDLIRIMTPLGFGTTTLMYDVYLRAFGGYNRGGYSAALATVLFVILLIVTLVQLRVMQRRVHYS